MRETRNDDDDDQQSKGVIGVCLTLMCLRLIFDDRVEIEAEKKDSQQNANAK